MYHVVGCSECSALRIVEGRPERSSCTRCGASKQFSKLKRFVSTEDVDHAREVRASMLANRQGEGEAFANVDSFAAMEDEVGEGVVDDDEFLERSGVDAAAAQAAADRAETGRASSSGPNKREAVLEALRALDDPTLDEIAAYAADHGVEREYVERALEKLERAGEVSRSGTTYRRL
ncbi:DUF5817 domain-containing protein [Halorubellus sp. PRR65]|uniref:DUF5817 domain-containing protein n=1 Tax=Halorubellus sp. PRR65 TaxID=3098148 RepID=UPI002B25DAE9|nr:DUF5817 domain-containing protein [Halorubellus sp. PRR65]